MKRIQKLFYLAGLLIFIHACKTSNPVVEAPQQVMLDTVAIEANSKLDIYRASEKRLNDLLHTRLEVSFDWDSAYLYGKANLQFTPYFYPTNELILDAKGFQIAEVSLVDSIGKRSSLSYTYDTSFIKIDLGKTYTRKDTYNIFVEYTAMPNKLEAGGSAAITSEKGLYFINPDGSDPKKPKQIWTQGETESSSCWFPTIDAPNEKTTQEIYITVDSNYVTLSNGALIFQTENEDGTRTDYWKQNLPHAPYLFMMAIGEFAVVEDEWRDIPVNYYVEPKFKKYAKDIYPNTPEMIEFFSNKLGYDYPWDKYHQVVVRDYVSGAMENTGAVIFGDFVQGNDRFLIDNAAEDVVAHELFHHWFGDLVTCESWSNLPLNESFATYGEHLWIEYKYGKDQGDYKGRNDLQTYLAQARINKKQLIRYNYMNQMEMFDAHSYHKGGRVLHMLRNYVGDDAFFAALKLYLSDNEFNTVEIHDLRLAFEEVSGEDLNWFFNQWFLSAGHPIIEVEENFIDSTNTLEVKIIQTQEGDNIPEVFDIPTKLGIVLADESIMVEEIRLTQRHQTFSFDMDKAPLLVNLDWDKVLLGEIDQSIEKKQAVTLYKSANHYLDKYDALKKLKNKKDEASLDIMAKALDDSFWFIRKAAIDNGKKLAQNRSEFMLSKLKEMAIEDEKSSVRAEAISAISKYFEEEIDVAFLAKGIDDLSYSVNSASLEAIYDKDEVAGLKLAQQLEDEESNSLLLEIARIYAEEGGVDKHSFFQEKLDELTGFNRYPLIISYGEYLSKQENETIEPAATELKELSMGPDSWFVRMAAINVLVKLKKEKEENTEALGEKLNATEDLPNLEALKSEKEEEEKIIQLLISALKEINAEEKNRNLKRILERELD